METINFKRVNLKANKVNLGINVLKVILSYWVLSFHCASDKIKATYKILNTYYHVPTFMVISFYFSYNLFYMRSVTKAKQRIKRLLIPYLIVAFIHLMIREHFFQYDKKEFKGKIKRCIIILYLQYITGYTCAVHLWYIQILILFTIFFFIIFSVFRKNSIVIIQIIQIISYLIQYSEMNYKIFFKHKRHIKSISHIAEIIPFAITGLTFAHIKILKIFVNHRIKFIIYFITILIIIYNYNVFGHFKGFPYSGVEKNIAAICLFISFSLIPFEKIKHKKLVNIITLLTSYSGGIYFFHRIINHIILKIKHSKRNNNNFYNCIVIYLVCYIFCMIGTKIFKNTNLKYLFN